MKELQIGQQQVAKAAQERDSQAAITALTSQLQQAPANFGIGDRATVRGFVVYPCYSVEALSDTRFTPMRLAAAFTKAAEAAGFTALGKNTYQIGQGESAVIVRYQPLAGCFDVMMGQQ